MRLAQTYLDGSMKFNLLYFGSQNPTIGAAFLTQSVQVDDHTVRFEVRATTACVPFVSALN